ncbi:MAG: PVC-type heme-binding CxxCH protein [Bacteroidota bacterium]
MPLTTTTFRLLLIISLVMTSTFWACKSQKQDSPEELTEAEKRMTEHALAGLEIAEGLELSLFASEPMLLNPTNIDIDERGRVWVCEAFNYRINLNPDNPQRAEGDRIVILEDTDGDGKADKDKVFYQGPEINSALGICVVGNQVIVSVSPNIFVFTDEDGDDVPDKKEVLFTGIGGEQHDHGAHAFSFGPDGKWYFNFGNEGTQLLHADDTPVLDQTGTAIHTEGKPYHQGMVFRCDPGGENVEVLAHNFRNNYEVAVDAFGTLWQSDNDDDGNQAARINYVMEHGNFGFKDERTGAGWRAFRTGMSPKVPIQHWYQNDPGVVPNLLQTGSGSPTGMIVYEGNLLPEQFRNQMIHCEPGHNVVRSYPVEQKGAGYEASIVNLVKGIDDNWFRPSDVCVAPDGSVFIADWYDPGVGGHRMGDTARGRIYRLAPVNHKYQVSTIDCNTAEGALKALLSPNLSVRAKGWTALHQMGEKGEAVLQNLWNAGESPRFRARALWLLSKIPGKEAKYIDEALQDQNSDIRILGLRAARQSDLPIMPYLQQLAKDSSPQVRREVALALRFIEGKEADQVWVSLAQQYNRNDRWYLEALGIGSDKFAEDRFSAWLEAAGSEWNTPSGKNIVWRSHAKAAIPMLGELILETPTALASERYFRALDFYPKSQTHPVLERLLNRDHPEQAGINYLAIRSMAPANIRKSAKVKAQLNQLLSDLYGTEDYLRLVDQLELKEQVPQVFRMALDNPANSLGQQAMVLLREYEALNLFEASVNSDQAEEVAASISILSMVGNDESLKILNQVVHDETKSMRIRQSAIQAMGKGWRGQHLLNKLLETDSTLVEDLKIAGANAMLGSYNESFRQSAMEILNLNQGENPLPPIQDLLAQKGNAEAGKAHYQQYCSTCHVVNDEGINFGPGLSEIGSKLSKEAIYGAILNPSAGIGFGYEGFLVTTKDGQIYQGFITSKTEDEVILRMNGGIDMPVDRKKIESMEMMDISLMTPGLGQVIGQQGLVDLVEYLSSLKTVEEFASN